MDHIDPLTNEQQIFLQRLFAHHVVTDDEAQNIYNQILQSSQGNFLGRDVKDTFRRINESLKPAFRLEIKSVALALSLPSDDDDNDDDDHDKENARANNRPKSVVYHSIVNCDNDDVAKLASNPTMTKSPHEFAYFRLVLEKMLDLDSRNSDSTVNTRGRGCTSYMNRNDLINLRLDLPEPHKDKLTIAQTENTLNLLEKQKWLVPALPMEGDGTTNATTNEEGEDNDASTPTLRKRKHRSSSSYSGSSSSTTTTRNGQSKYLQIGPRSYLEFPDHLVKAGLEDEKLPQFLFHG